MQRLHLVGLTEDADGLIFSTRRGSKSGGFVVAVDPDLLAVLEEAQGGSAKARSNGRGAAQPVRHGGRPESQLSPREMQELLRAGWTLEEVAAEGGVDVEWVSRFAAPVMAEIQRVVDQALDAVFEKPRAGVSALPLGPSVRRNLAERGVRLTDEDFADGWRAFQLDEITWMVCFAYTSRGRAQEATWAIDLEQDELVARNRLGTQLGHVASIRRKVSTAPPPKPKPPASVVKRAATKVPAPAPAPARRRPAASKATKATKVTRSGRTAKATKKVTKKKASAAKRSAGRKRPAPPQATLVPPETVVPAAPPPRPNTTRDVYRDELRRRQAIEAADRPSPRPPTPEPELPAASSLGRGGVRGPMPPPAPLPVPAVVREKVAAPIGTFDIEHDRKDDLDVSPFAEEPWYPTADAEPDVAPSPPTRVQAARTERVRIDAPPPAPAPAPAAEERPAVPRDRRPREIARSGAEDGSRPASGAEEPPPRRRPAPEAPSPPRRRPAPERATDAPRPEPTADRRPPRPEPTVERRPRRPEPTVERRPPPAPPAPAPAPAPAPPVPVRSEEPAATTPVFHGARAAAAEAPARPRRREPLRAR